ncbi:hypothetical protein ACMD2_17856 [Ananas comosus]|uniref:Uncharacterized protein n=1 Tax=Ananas comosus TaxID=4615 RepID=A0A199VSU1_ANACO|nr:hypothetical protein ACMD2_17856 [Ananas comosus]
MGSMVGGSGGGGKNCSVDLKLGGLGDFAPAAPEKWRNVCKARLRRALEARAPAGAPRRPPPPASSTAAIPTSAAAGTTTAGTRSAKSTPRPPSSWSAARSRDFASSAAVSYSTLDISIPQEIHGARINSRD